MTKRSLVLLSLKVNVTHSEVRDYCWTIARQQMFSIVVVYNHLLKSGLFVIAYI